jgi:hypothetical protein
MTPRELAQLWVKTFNRSGAEGLATFLSVEPFQHGHGVSAHSIS